MLEEDVIHIKSFEIGISPVSSRIPRPPPPLALSLAANADKSLTTAAEQEPGGPTSLASLFLSR
jgi:hypothetical protein